MADEPCPICGEYARPTYPGVGMRPVERIDCDRCGRYSVSARAERELEGLGSESREKAMLAGVTRERSVLGNPIVLRASTGEPTEGEDLGVRISEALESLVPRSVPDRVDRGLLYFASRSADPGSRVEIVSTRDWPLFFVERQPALHRTLRYMIDSGLLVRDPGGDGNRGTFALTEKGWARVEARERPRSRSRQCFVAMWFDPEMDAAFDQGIRKAIEEAEYAGDRAGYTAMRVDMVQFNEKICDQIINELRRSHFAVVDVTKHRRPVYFEAGYAMGAGLPVIFTCRKGALRGCCFDTRQYNHIVWESIGGLRERLRARIEATVPPPARS